MFRVAQFLLITLASVTAASMARAATTAAAPSAALPNPILFVTQFPQLGDFAAIESVFANHRGDVDLTGRGGDLYIRYPDGSLRNLTQEAGYGNAGGTDP